MIAISLNDGKIFLFFFWDVVFVGHDLNQAKNCVERRADFMVHMGQKRDFSLLACSAFFEIILILLSARKRVFQGIFEIQRALH